jgi:argininosuccinate synthase
MKGHIEILKLRMRRIRPEIVFINDYQCRTDWFEWQEHATVCIENREAIETLDFRFVKGLVVSITGATEKRAKALFNACKAHGAATVAAGDMNESGWVEVYHG